MGDEQFFSCNHLSLERRSRGDARSCACAGPGLGLVSTTISAGDRPNPTRQREIESNECALQHASAAGALPQCNISTSVQRELPFYSDIQGTSLMNTTPYVYGTVPALFPDIYTLLFLYFEYMGTICTTWPALSKPQSKYYVHQVPVHVRSQRPSGYLWS